MLLAASLSCAVSGQTGQKTFVAIPPQEAARYHFDFARYYFATPEEEKTDRANLYATLKQLETLKGSVTNSAKNLLRALELKDSVQIQFYKHYSYLYLRNAVNTADETSLAESATLDSEINTRTAFMVQELMQLNEQTLNAFVGRKPELKKYLPALNAIRRYQPHTLSLKEEELLSQISPNNNWQYDLYEKLRSRTPESRVPASADQSAREDAFKKSYAARASERELFAFLLKRLATSRTLLARLHHFPDAASEAYFRSYWTKAEVDQLVARIAERADVYKRYQRLRAEHVRKVYGYPQVNLWDMSAPEPGMERPTFTIDRATQIIRDALAPLGSEYGTELSSLLDPVNGRMDIVPGEHRKRGGFSQGFIGTDSVFYSGGFAGSYNDVRVLAHESTHAVHRQLMTRNHVLPADAEGPHYLFEAFAIFSEFLLLDYLASHETQPVGRQYYLEQFLEGKGTVMFSVAPEVALEHAVYDGVENGTITDPDELDLLTKQIYSRYSIWPEKHDELKATWINVGLMYEDPFYDVNYVYGALLALKFYELYTSDAKQFVPRYIALMKNGFDAPPETLLKRFLDIDLHDANLVANALNVVTHKVDELEKSYQAVSSPAKGRP